MACWITAARLEEQLAGEHPYVYAENNPTTYTDPTGLWKITPAPCKGITGKIVTVERPGDVVGIVGGTPPKGQGRFPGTPGEDCTKGFKNAAGKDCICVNGSFYSLSSGWPVGSFKDCQGRSVGGNDSGLEPIVTGHGNIHGFPSSRTLPSAGIKTGRTGACTSPSGAILFLLVIDQANGATGKAFLDCMKSLCKAPNKIVQLDGSGSSQIWHNGKPIYPGDKRDVANWIVICE